MFLTVNAGSGLRFAITTNGPGAEQRINAGSVLPLHQWSLVTVTLSGTTGTMGYPFTPRRLGRHQRRRRALDGEQALQGPARPL